MKHPHARQPAALAALIGIVLVTIFLWAQREPGEQKTGRLDFIGDSPRAARPDVSREEAIKILDQRPTLDAALFRYEAVLASARTALGAEYHLGPWAALAPAFPAQAGCDEFGPRFHLGNTGQSRTAQWINTTAVQAQGDEPTDTLGRIVAPAGFRPDPDDPLWAPPSTTAFRDVEGAVITMTQYPTQTGLILRTPCFRLDPSRPPDAVQQDEWAAGEAAFQAAKARPPLTDLSPDLMQWVQDARRHFSPGPWSPTDAGTSSAAIPCLDLDRHAASQNEWVGYERSPRWTTPTVSGTEWSTGITWLLASAKAKGFIPSTPTPASQRSLRLTAPDGSTLTVTGDDELSLVLTTGCAPITRDTDQIESRSRSANQSGRT